MNVLQILHFSNIFDVGLTGLSVSSHLESRYTVVYEVQPKINVLSNKKHVCIFRGSHTSRKSVFKKSVFK